MRGDGLLRSCRTEDEPEREAAVESWYINWHDFFSNIQRQSFEGEMTELRPVSGKKRKKMATHLALRITPIRRFFRKKSKDIKKE